MKTKPIVRWTIGKTTLDGYKCLDLSISSFLNFYDADVVVCCNTGINLPDSVKKYPILDQTKYLDIGPNPKGVAWKLYPPRIDVNRYEICIDNDIVFNEKISQIDEFLNSSSTLLLEDCSRTYGRFEKHVPPKFQINSGIYGMPPGFDFESYVKFYSGNEWQKNAFNQHDQSETFDEQGIVALALLNHSSYIIIPKNIVTNCEHHLVEGKANHFIGLNRRNFHSSFKLYLSQNKKIQM